MRRVAFLTACFGLVALAAFGQSTASGSFTSPAGRFTVRFPAQVEESSESQPTAVGQIEMHLFSAETADEFLHSFRILDQ